MRIWLLRRRYAQAGGAERFTQRLATVLNQSGYQICIATESWPEAKDDSYQIEKIPSKSSASYARICSQHAPHWNGLIFSLERTLKQNIYRAGDGIHASWLKRRSHYQSSIQRLWSSWSWKHRAILRLEKEVFRPEITKWVVANSQMVQKEILEYFNFPEERIRVIHPGVDLKIFQPYMGRDRRNELRNFYGVPEDAIVWSFVGSGFARKGLIWAIQIAAAQKQPIWLLVLGKGKRTFFEKVAKELGFDSRLRFLPNGTNSLDVYHASDAFILPTIYDPCSNACLEAAACGLPVITTESNGAAEWIYGVVLKDPSKINEASERCSIYAQPLQPMNQLTELRMRLDDQRCWSDLLQLIQEASSLSLNAT